MRNQIKPSIRNQNLTSFDPEGEEDSASSKTKRNLSIKNEASNDKKLVQRHCVKTISIKPRFS